MENQVIEITDVYSLGKLFKQRRQEKKLTILAASKLLGISTTTIAHLETAVNVPGPDLLRKMCEFFDVPFVEANKIMVAMKLERTRRRLES